MQRMGEVIQIQVQTKTEQRVEHIISLLRSAKSPMTYDDIRIASGAVRREDNTLIGGVAYDMLLFVITTLIFLGHVKRTEVIEGKGHPRYLFEWVNVKQARALGARKPAA